MISWLYLSGGMAFHIKMRSDENSLDLFMVIFKRRDDFMWTSFSPILFNLVFLFVYLFFLRCFLVKENSIMLVKINILYNEVCVFASAKCTLYFIYLFMSFLCCCLSNISSFHLTPEWKDSVVRKRLNIDPQRRQLKLSSPC